MGIRTHKESMLDINVLSNFHPVSKLAFSHNGDWESSSDTALGLLTGTPPHLSSSVGISAFSLYWNYSHQSNYKHICPQQWWWFRLNFAWPGCCIWHNQPLFAPSKTKTFRTHTQKQFWQFRSIQTIWCKVLERAGQCGLPSSKGI